LNKLLVVKNSIVAKMLAVRTEKDYEDMVEFVASTKSEIFDITGELYPCVIDKNKLFVIDNALKQKFLDAGYTRIKVYWLDENNIAVLNNPLLENISEEDFRKYAVESGLPDVKYSYFDKKDFKGKIFVDSLVWIRLNPNSAQDAYFEKLKMLLISDKKNYSIKTRFILK